MKNDSSMLTIFSSVILFTLLGLGYSFYTPKMYSAKGQIALFRAKIENPETPSDESRNRWIWIRDGLTMKSAVLTDRLIDEVIAKDSTAGILSVKFDDKNKMYEHFKKMVNLQFTGADEFNFLVEVKAPDPMLAYTFCTVIMERIKYLAVEEDQKNFAGLLAHLTSIQESAKTNKEAYAFYEDKIRKLTLNYTILQDQRAQSFKIISPAYFNEVPVWPNRKLIVLAFFLLGLVLGNGLSYFLKSARSKSGEA